VQEDLDRFLALVRRELGAEHARVLDPEEKAPETDDPRELACLMPDGRTVVARFPSSPPDREAQQRRLEMLASTFDAIVEEVTGHLRKPRPPVARSLHDELQKLRARAAAVNVLVIDANSPVVWGAARPEGVVDPAPMASSPRVADQAMDAQASAGAEEEAGVAAVSRRALQLVRTLPDIAALRKGRHVRHVERGGDAPWLAHSFAGIYLLVLVYAAPFDELRAERAIIDALPRIERLVLALPPLDPSPGEGAGVIAIRRPRRR
jgi:hypothetical protein